MNKVALITGITGQDGSYLAEQLLDKGYEVHGLVRRASTFNTARLENLYRSTEETQKIHIHYIDAFDSLHLFNLIESISPDEIYNLMALSHVAQSFDQPGKTFAALKVRPGNFAQLPELTTKTGISLTKRRANRPLSLRLPTGFLII